MVENERMENKYWCRIKVHIVSTWAYPGHCNASWWSYSKIITWQFGVHILSYLSRIIMALPHPLSTEKELFNVYYHLASLPWAWTFFQHCLFSDQDCTACRDSETSHNWLFSRGQRDLSHIRQSHIFVIFVMSTLQSMINEQTCPLAWSPHHRTLSCHWPVQGQDSFLL